MCVIGMAATYTVFFPASLWKTMTVSSLPPHTKGTCTLLSKCTLGPQVSQAWASPSPGGPSPPRGLGLLTDMYSHKGPTGGQCGVQDVQVPPAPPHGRQQLVCGEVGKGILGKESQEGQRQGDGHGSC